jgi:hypothetical protein
MHQLPVELRRLYLEDLHGNEGHPRDAGVVEVLGAVRLVRKDLGTRLATEYLVRTVVFTDESAEDWQTFDGLT